MNQENRFLYRKYLKDKYLIFYEILLRKECQNSKVLFKLDLIIFGMQYITHLKVLFLYNFFYQ